MKNQKEKDLLLRSERYFSTPSATAKAVFYFITSCGHYFCGSAYDYRNECNDKSRNFILCCVRDGSMRICTECGEFECSVGQVALIDGTKPHRICAADESEVFWMCFGGCNSRDYYEHITALHGGRNVFCPSSQLKIEKDINQILAEQKDDNAIHEAEQSQRVHRILCSLIYERKRDEMMAGIGDPIKEAVHYIAANCGTELTVERIAGKVNLSTAYFSKQFREYTGCSPHEYCLLCRINEAKAMLVGSSMSVKEIAYAVGYQSEASFSNLFKEKVGNTPAVFRQNRL